MCVCVCVRSILKSQCPSIWEISSHKTGDFSISIYLSIYIYISRHKTGDFSKKKTLSHKTGDFSKKKILFFVSLSISHMGNRK